MDKWKSQREKAWANTEPSVRLVAMTAPVSVDEFDGESVTTPEFLEPDLVESLVAEAAAVSTGIEPKDSQKLVQKLIKMGHMVPTEFVDYTFLITGISKACSAQISRHRMASIVSASRRYQEQGAAFVYPLLDSIDDEDTARRIYALLSDSYKEAYSNYMGLKSLGAKKGDCRYVIPVASATSKTWKINARSLRNFLQLRLDPTAEAEIRRLANMILAIVKHITPTLFEDFQ